MTQFFAVVLPALILFCGLSIDVGIIELTRLQMQSAADAAVLGAEVEAERGTGNWVNIGQAEAGINGFTNGLNNASVTLIQKATNGPYAGRYDTVQATITQPVHTVFMGMLNGGTINLTVQSAALITPCAFFSNAKGLQTYALQGVTGSLIGNTCPIYVNTNMSVGPAAQVAVEAVDVAGSSGASSNSGYVYPAPAYNVPAAADPLATLAAPTFVGCNHTSFSVTGGLATLNPGTYCKGLNLTNAIVTLNPGLYIITGGATWSGATVFGSGVTLFFTQGGGGGFGQFKVLYSIVSMSAPTDSSSGGIPAILVFADRNWVATGAQDFQLNTSPISGDGVWYLSGAGLALLSCGNISAPHYLGIVADNLYYSGTILQLSNNYSYVATGDPMRRSGTLIQ